VTYSRPFRRFEGWHNSYNNDPLMGFDMLLMYTSDNCIFSSLRTNARNTFFSWLKITHSCRFVSGHCIEGTDTHTLCKFLI
jgi:hypothetical protein